MSTVSRDVERGGSLVTLVREWPSCGPDRDLHRGRSIERTLGVAGPVRVRKQTATNWASIAQWLSYRPLLFAWFRAASVAWDAKARTVVIGCAVYADAWGQLLRNPQHDRL